MMKNEILVAFGLFTSHLHKQADNALTSDIPVKMPSYHFTFSSSSPVFRILLVTFGVDSARNRIIRIEFARNFVSKLTEENILFLLI